MNYISHYQSPLGELLLSADAVGITGVWFDGQKYFAKNLGTYEEKDLPVFLGAKQWLDIYFSGREPMFRVPVHLRGTEFQKSVWEILLTIPYGKTMTYGEIAKTLAAQRGLSRMSAQAVGGAVGRNPVSILVPCHRVIGAGGSLTGYAGGLERKMALLKLEQVDMTELFVP